jgi:hypothetical protein
MLIILLRFVKAERMNQIIFAHYARHTIAGGRQEKMADLVIINRSGVFAVGEGGQNRWSERAARPRGQSDFFLYRITDARTPTKTGLN